MHLFNLSWIYFSSIVLILLGGVKGQNSLNELPFLQLNISDGVETEAVGHFDDGASHAIHLPNGFPFDGTVHSFLYIGTNGILSFEQPVYSPSTLFPSTRNEIRNLFIVAPFWDDVDLRRSGDILYEVHSSFSGNAASIDMLSTVNDFISEEIGEEFDGSWMVVAKWDKVHPWPHGEPNINPIYLFIFPDYIEENTWQAVIVTNGNKSYAIFTYQCGSLSWSRGTVIGYNAAGRDFMNHPLSGGPDVASIACSNAPNSNWTNVFYDITGTTINITEPSTVEPPQQEYLARLPFLNVSNSGILNPCRNCSSGPINLGSPGIPFGYYYHERLYVSVNGIISFDREFNIDFSENFPSMDGSLYYSYLATPYWSNIDTRRSGTVRYESYLFGDSLASDNQLQRVNEFINTENDPNFQGYWMLLASWENVHPYPHGDAAETGRDDPYLESTNTFQAIIISNNTKTYAVYTYYCDDMAWSDEATIGFNAAGDFYRNHPLGGFLHANAIGCVHLNDGTILNNVVYDLVPVPGTSINITTPPTPPRFLGSCVQQGYTDCCESGSCLASDCMCDEFCHLANDCCLDIESTCNRDTPPDNDTFLIFANDLYINRLNVDGSFFHIISEYDNQRISGIDYDYRRGKIYWSDTVNDQILRSNFDGSVLEVMANATHENIEDIAVDWVGNNLYWTESITGNIEALDLDTLERVVILNTGAHTIPRGIALDPSVGKIFWTQWSDPAKIESASMDGSNRQVLHSTGMVWPNGIALDYITQRIYWVDALLDRIEYSSYNGSNRVVLLSGLPHPFAITVEDNLVFWTDWAINSVFSAHKETALGVGTVREFLRERPYGIESVSPTRQANLTNPCLSNSCSHICLLSSTDTRGYSCMCPRGFQLQPNQIDCIDVGTIRPPPLVGSCADAGYTQCCSYVLSSTSPDFCVGSEPYNCFCDRECVLRGDCCPDIESSCPMSTGSCVDAGYQACCNIELSTCRGSDDVCLCDYACLFFGDCCSDYLDVCSGGIEGSCSSAGYSTCCESGDCFGMTPNCKCDEACRNRSDCCGDIDTTCSISPPTTTEMVTTEEVTTMEMTTPTPTEMTTPPVQQPSSPDRVANLNVLVNSDTSLFVSWLGNNSGGAGGTTTYSLKITNYTGEVVNTSMISITSSLNSDGGMNYSVSISRNIGPYIPYNITVFGFIGTSRSPSQSKFYVFTKEAAPPVSPSGIEYKRENDTRISVKWNRITPDKALGIVQNYTISYKKFTKKRDVADIGLKVVGREEDQTVIDGLDNGADYSLFMWATTSAGKGKVSSPQNVTVFDSSPAKQSSLAGPVVGGIIGVVIFISFVVIVIFLSMYFIRKKNKNASTSYVLSGNSTNTKKGDEEELITTSLSFKHTDPPNAYDNPLYDKRSGEGTSPSSVSGGTEEKDPDYEMLKEDLGMI